MRIALTVVSMLVRFSRNNGAQCIPFLAFFFMFFLVSQAQGESTFTAKIALQGLRAGAEGTLDSEFYIAKQVPEYVLPTIQNDTDPELSVVISKEGTSFFSVVARWQSSNKDISLFIPALYVPKSQFPSSRSYTRRERLANAGDAFFLTRRAATREFRLGNHLVGLHLLERAMQSGYIAPGDTLNGMFEVLNSFRKEFKDERRLLGALLTVLQNNVDRFDGSPEYVNLYLNFLSNFAEDGAHNIQVFSTELRDWRVSQIRNETSSWDETYPPLFRQLVRKHKNGRDFRGCIAISSHFLRFFDVREFPEATNRLENSRAREAFIAVMVEGINCLRKEHASTSNEILSFNPENFRSFVTSDPEFSSFSELFSHLARTEVDLAIESSEVDIIHDHFSYLR